MTSEKRADPSYARQLLGSYLPEPESRRFFLQLLADLIQLAHQESPSSWGVTLRENGRVQLNVGSLACLYIKDQVKLFWLHEDNLVEPPEAKSEFIRIPLGRSYLGAPRDSQFWAERLRPQIEALTKTFAQQFPTLWVASRRKHSPGVLRYLEEELNITLPDPQYPHEVPTQFTWIPFFQELAEHALTYRSRQDELIGLVRRLDERGRKVVPLNDRDAADQIIPLTVHDPFTFFASFCRAITWTNKKDIFTDLKSEWALETPIPTDLNGVPEVNNQSAWFFSYAAHRHTTDLDDLWDIAEQAVEGPDALTEGAWRNALGVRQVGLAKLTIGLFWLNPLEFLPLDRNVRSYLQRAGVSVPDHPTVEQYRQLLHEAQQRLNKSLPEISYAAFLNTPVSPPRYWAGGHQWDDGSRLDEFRAQSAWWHGFPSTDPSEEAKKTFACFEEIAVGDYLAVKGYGGRNHLRVHLVGRVTEKAPETQRVQLELLPLPDPQTIQPATGTGSWFPTLREVTNPAMIAWMFQQQPYVPKPTEMIPMPSFPLNTILYGPPGTGKTYETAQRAVKIIDGTAPYDRKKLMERYRILQREGRIGFVTFHQSYAYEDFIEGIRPVMDEEAETSGTPRYQIVDGILKELALNALGDSLEAPISPASTSPSFDLLWATLIEKIESDPDWTLKGLSSSEYQLTLTPLGNLQGTNVKGNAQHPYSATRSKIEKAWHRLPADVEPTHNALMAVFQVGTHTNLIGAVIKELRAIAKTPLNTASLPEKPASEKALDFLMRGDDSAYTDKTNPPRYVLIVDEINRGNISKILGELITLLEDDKRIGKDNELTVTLPYSRQPFALPPNLYLIGTMNTADRSLALLDVALRRRFTFEELTPNFTKCDPELAPEMRKALDELNRRITLRKDRDHRIGHAFFMNVGTDSVAFNTAFTGKVLPLLQEYFFNDWAGLRDVLGEKDEKHGFVHPLKQTEQDKGARNRWQWATDAGIAVDPLEQLKKNYGSNPSS